MCDAEDIEWDELDVLTPFEESEAQRTLLWTRGESGCAAILGGCPRRTLPLAKG